MSKEYHWVDARHLQVSLEALFQRLGTYDRLGLAIFMEGSAPKVLKAYPVRRVRASFSNLHIYLKRGLTEVERSILEEAVSRYLVSLRTDS